MNIDKNEACRCGHRRGDHSGGPSRRGVCIECYIASDHGMAPYCSRFVRGELRPVVECSYTKRNRANRTEN